MAKSSKSKARVPVSFEIDQADLDVLDLVGRGLPMGRLTRSEMLRNAVKRYCDTAMDMYPEVRAFVEAGLRPGLAIVRAGSAEGTPAVRAASSDSEVK